MCHIQHKSRRIRWYGLRYPRIHHFNAWNSRCRCAPSSLISFHCACVTCPACKRRRALHMATGRNEWVRGCISRSTCRRMSRCGRCFWGETSACCRPHTRTTKGCSFQTTPARADECGAPQGQVIETSQGGHCYRDTIGGQIVQPLQKRHRETLRVWCGKRGRGAAKKGEKRSIRTLIEYLNMLGRLDTQRWGDHCNSTQAMALQRGCSGLRIF